MSAPLPPPSFPAPPPAAPTRRRRWVPVAIGAAVAIVVAGAAIATVAVVGGENDDGGGCVVALAGRVSGQGYVEGADFERARAAGFDDAGNAEDLSESMIRTGTLIDPWTRRVLNSSFEVDPDETGYATGDLACWIGGNEETLLRGSFDADRLADSSVARANSVALDDDVAAIVREGDAESVLARDEDAAPGPLRAAVAALEDAGVYSFVVLNAGDDRNDGLQWVGMGVASSPGDDDPSLVMVWTYLDDQAASRDLSSVQRRLDDGNLDETMRFDPDDLERRGDVLVLQGEVVGEAGQWTRPISLLDPALFDEN